MNFWTKNEDFEQCADGIKKSAQFDYMRNETDRRFHLDTNLTSSFGRQEVTEIQKKKNTLTVFENHRKSLIQHCERSELCLH